MDPDSPLSMQQTASGSCNPSPTLLNAGDYRPTVVIWPGPPPSSGSIVPDDSPDRYLVLDGEAVIVRWIGTSPTIHSEITNDPNGVFKRGLPSENAHFLPTKSQVRFYPQGVHSQKYCRIEGSACAYTDGKGSYICRPNGGVQGPYPFHPQLSRPPPSTQNPTDSSPKSLQSHSSLLNPPSSHHPANSPLPDKRSLDNDPTDNDFAYGEFIQDEYVHTELGSPPNQ